MADVREALFLELNVLIPNRALEWDSKPGPTDMIVVGVVDRRI